jgi:thiamine-phosphate pyrophosphorylase
MTDRLARARLYLLATASVASRPLEDAVAGALRGGVDVVQLREKELDGAELLARARELRALCDAHGALFVVNDDVLVARDAGADGVHLGQDDASVAEARAALGGEALVGVSTHSAAELDAALRAGADYVGVGSLFPTATKARATPVGSPAGLAPLAARAEAAGVPAFGIGGVDARNVVEVAAAGFRRMAVCAAILRSPYPEGAARRLRSALDDA